MFARYDVRSIWAGGANRVHAAKYGRLKKSSLAFWFVSGYYENYQGFIRSVFN